MDAIRQLRLDDTPRPHHDDNDATITHPAWRDYGRSAPGDSIQESGLGDYQVAKGIEGENATVREISTMTDKHHLINSIKRTSKSDIDHILIYRKGIVVINSKNYSNDLLINGMNVSYTNSRGRACPTHDWQGIMMNEKADIMGTLASRWNYRDIAASIPIHMVFAIWNARIRIIGDNPIILFINGQDIIPWLESRRTTVTLDDNLIDYLYADMRRSTFWNHDTSL